MGALGRGNQRAGERGGACDEVCADRRVDKDIGKVYDTPTNGGCC